MKYVRNKNEQMNEECDNKIVNIVIIKTNNPVLYLYLELNVYCVQAFTTNTLKPLRLVI